MEELETPTASLRQKECVITKIEKSMFYTVCRIIHMQNESCELFNIEKPVKSYKLEQFKSVGKIRRYDFYY